MAGVVLTNVYVRGLPIDWDKDTMDQLFGEYGRIVSSKVLYNNVTTASRGIGFIRYATHESAAAAIEALNGHVPQNAMKQLVVQFAKGSNQIQPSPSYTAERTARAISRYFFYGASGSATQGKDLMNLYICDIPPSTTEAEFKGWFTPYGTVTSSHLLVDQTTGLAKGIGFCRFSDEQAAAAALTANHGRPMGMGEKPLCVTYAKNTSHKIERKQEPAIAQPVYAQPQYVDQYGNPVYAQYYQTPQGYAIAAPAPAQGYPQYAYAQPQAFVAAPQVGAPQQVVQPVQAQYDYRGQPLPSASAAPQAPNQPYPPQPPNAQAYVAPNSQPVVAQQPVPPPQPGPVYAQTPQQQYAAPAPNQPQYAAPAPNQPQYAAPAPNQPQYGAPAPNQPMRLGSSDMYASGNSRGGPPPQQQQYYQGSR
jgi:RNA recognition motif-containing protein